MSLKDQVAAIFRSIIPTRTVIRYDRRNDPPSIASALDVDMLHAIIQEAEHGNPRRLFALYRDILSTDTEIQGDLGVRKEAVLGDSLHVLPWDKKDPADTAAAAAVEEMIADMPDWEDSLRHLLDSTLYPVAVVEKIYRPSRTPGLSYELARLKPVPYELLEYRDYRLQIADTDDRGNRLTTAHDPDPRRYIVARIHTLNLCDWWGGPMRALLFWWLLCVQDRHWWAQFLDRYGTPFVVGKYNENNDADRAILERAFSLAKKLGGLVVNRETDVELKQAAASDSGQAYERFLEVCQREKAKFILGQNLSSQSAPTGLGSGVANLQASVREDKRQADARRLGSVLREQLVKQYLQINGITGRAPVMLFGGVSASETAATAALLEKLPAAGLRIGDEGLETLSERFGLPIERAAPAAPLLPFSSVVPLASTPEVRRSARAEEATQRILSAAAADLARTFRGRYAAIPQLILSSTSPEDAETRIIEHLRAEDPGRAARLLEEVMLSLAANGAAVHARPDS